MNESEIMEVIGRLYVGNVLRDRRIAALTAEVEAMRRAETAVSTAVESNGHEADAQVVGSYVEQP